MTPDAREKLADIVRQLRHPSAVADAILAAYPQIAEAPPSGNEAVEAARSILARPQHHIMPEERIAATYILSLAPGKDVVSGAREVVVTFMMNYDGSKPRDLADLEKAIARFAAEREARVREECCKVVCSLCLANHPLSAKRPEVHEYRGTYVMCKAAAIRAGSGK